jgi:alcohol dehydrogenase
MLRWLASEGARAKRIREGAMKAIVFHEHGGLDKLWYEDFPDPELKPDEILIRVRAVALNGFDPMVLRSIPGLRTPLPMIPGADIAGEIVAIGDDVAKGQWKIGARVTVIPNQADGMMGETKRGGASELVAIQQEYVLLIPDAVSFVNAACLPVAYGTAIRMLETRGRLKAGDKVLILGASVGVGTCCVQLAKSLGCEVIACASSTWKVAKLKEPGPTTSSIRAARTTSPFTGSMESPAPAVAAAST